MLPKNEFRLAIVAEEMMRVFCCLFAATVVVSRLAQTPGDSENQKKMAVSNGGIDLNYGARR